MRTVKIISALNLNFRKKTNGVPILSKEEIDYFAELFITDFKPELLKIPQPTPIEEFVELYLGLSVDYHNLSPDKSVLGMIAYNDGYVDVFDDKNKKRSVEVYAGTVFIDNALLDEDQRGRCRFTFGHEPGHWIFHRHRYVIDKNQINIFDYMDEAQQQQQKVYVKCDRNTVGKISRHNGGFNDDGQWMEWQADYFSSAILMPKRSFKMAAESLMGQFGLRRDYFKSTPIPTSFDDARRITSSLAQTFDVSFQASAIRLNKLGYFDYDLCNLVLVV